ncbi:MAG: AP2 domain-containing protein [Chloroflexota bacterium]
MTHIVRINQPRNKTVGYQFRGRNKTKFFSDSQYGSSKRAKDAAEAYQAEYEEASLEPIGRKPFDVRRQRNNKSGVVGVYRSYSRGRHDKTIKRYYWAAHYTIDRFGKTGIRRYQPFYIDVHGHDEARRLAIEFRQEWERAAEKGTDAVRAFFVGQRDTNNTDNRFN